MQHQNIWYPCASNNITDLPETSMVTKELMVGGGLAVMASDSNSIVQFMVWTSHFYEIKEVPFTPDHRVVDWMFSLI